MDNNRVSSYEEYRNIGRVTKEPSEKITMGSETIEKRLAPTEISFWDSKAKKYFFRPKTSFLKVYVPDDSAVPDLYDALDEEPKDIGQIMLIMRHIDNDNMIQYRDKHNKQSTPANKKILYQMISKNPEVARRFVKKMMDKGIIRKWESEWEGGKIERFFINPLYTVRDKGISLNLYKLFKEELDLYLTDKAKKDLGTLLYYENNPDELVKLQDELACAEDESIEAMFEEMKAKCESQQVEVVEEAEEYTIEHGGAKDGFFKRNVFIPVNDDYDVAKDAFINQCNNKDVYYGAYAHGNKGSLYGELYIDLDSHSALESEEGFQNIVGQARNVVAFFRDEMKIPVAEQEIFFSGSKGFHVTISPEVFGIQPTKDLNNKFKAIAKKIKEECAPDVDTAIYDASRLFRYPNSINGKTGLYKVLVSYEMLSNCTLDEMKDWASQQREMASMNPQLIQEAAEAYQKLTKETEVRVAKRIIKKAPAANSSLLPCIQSMLDNGAEVGQRNETTVALASGLLQAKRSYEEVVEQLKEWNNDCNAEPLSETELMNTINSAHQMFLDDKKYGCTKYSDLGYCSETCHLCQKIA